MVKRRAGEESVPLAEERDAGGIAVEEVVPADRADLTHGEKTAHRNPAHMLPDGRDVVVGGAEEPLAASVAADRKSTRLNSSHIQKSRMPSSA